MSLQSFGRAVPFYRLISPARWRDKSTPFVRLKSFHPLATLSSYRFQVISEKNETRNWNDSHLAIHVCPVGVSNYLTNCQPLSKLLPWTYH